MEISNSGKDSYLAKYENQYNTLSNITSYCIIVCRIIRAFLMAQMVKNLPAMLAGINPWVGNILWRREWLPNPIFLLCPSF